MLEKYSVVLVFTSLFIRQVLMQNTGYTTISVSDAIGDYYRKIKLCEENKNFKDSQSSIIIHSVKSLKDIGEQVGDDEDMPDAFKRTTYDKRFVTKVRRPAGYHRNILLNKSTSALPTSTRSAEVTSNTKTTAEVSSTKPSRFNASAVRTMLGDETTTWVTPWRITPYKNYDSEHERAVQREFPHRKKMMDDIIQKHIRKLRNISSDTSYSSESVPSSCECHAGNWSESYNFVQKWKQKQCKPKYLNLEYGLNSQGTELRAPDEEEHSSESSSREFKKKRKYLRGKRRGRGRGKEYSESYDTDHEVYNGRKVYPPQMGHLQPIGYPQQMGYLPHLGYPPQMGYAPPMGYPPYYPYPMPPQYNHPAQYNPAHVDALSKKLQELHNEIKELKRSTTNNMWEQYLKLKEKFETTASTLTKNEEITTIQDRFHQYRKLEKQEPYYSKFVPNAENTNYYRRLYRTEEIGGYTFQSSRTRDYLFLRNGYSTAKRVERSRRTWFTYNRQLTTEFQETEIPNYLYKKEPDHAQNGLQFNQIRQSTNVQRKFENPTGWTLLKRAYKINVTSVPTINQNVQYASRTATITIAPQVKITRTIAPKIETTISSLQSTTENSLEVYKQYKKLYEFPDYNAEKRRILRAKEKEMKRKLYKARGLVYDEDPPRSTTRPSTTMFSQFYFKNKMEYYKWMFGDESLPLETRTRTPFNNAPTFNMDIEEERKKYLKWMFGDKSLEIDPISN